MAPGAPNNLKQKRTFIQRAGIKNVLVRGQPETRTQQSKGGTCITTESIAVETSEISPQSTSRISPQSTSEISPQTAESVEHTPNEEVAATALTSKKKSRGKTIGKGILKYFDTNKTKMKINVDPSIGRPINGDESAKLASQIGVITRDVLPVPKKWKDVDEATGLGLGFDHLQMHLDVNIDAPGVRHCLVNRMKISSRQKRYHLHKHFLQFATIEEAKKNKPSACPRQDNWDSLCDHFASDKFKHRSGVNRSNRQNLRCKHISGRKAFTVRSHEISERELGGIPCDRIDLYERTHSSEKDGWKSNEAKENWEKMKKNREEYIDLGIDKSSDEIVLEVLGHGTGYVKGLGYGPKPPSRRNTLYNHSSELQDELKDTKEKLQESEAQVHELKTQVAILNANMEAQGANVQKLMAFLSGKGIEL